MKLLRKVAGSKFLNKQPIVETDPNIYALKDENSKIYKSTRNGINLGVLSIKIDRAIISPMGFTRNLKNFIMKENAEWVLELTMQGQMLVSDPISTKEFILEIPASPSILSPRRNNNLFEDKESKFVNHGAEIRNSSNERNRSFNGNGIGAREVFFNFKESFYITELYSDLNIDLVCRVPIQCQPIYNQFDEVVDEDCYYSKNSTNEQNIQSSFKVQENSGSVSFKDFEEEVLLNDGVSSLTANDNNINNISSHNNTPNGYNLSSNIGKKKESNSAFGSTCKQYRVIRIEKKKPNCKVIGEKPFIDIDAKNLDSASQDHEWEVLYEYIHFGKVTIPISNIIYNEMIKLPCIDHWIFNKKSKNLKCNSENINTNLKTKNFIKNIFTLRKRNSKNSSCNSEEVLLKSNTIEEWTVLNEKKNNLDIDKKDEFLNSSNDEIDIYSHQDNNWISNSISESKNETKFTSDNKYENFNDDQKMNWYHLYPKTNEMIKYVKPVSGITEYGLSNPIKTLGFIQIGLDFECSSTSKIELLSNSFVNIMSSKPITRWILPVAFEPQYFQRYAEILKLLLEHYPRWVPKFCFLLNYRIPRSGFDRLMIFIFWSIIVFLFFNVNSFFWFSWLVMVILPIVISSTYRFGSQIVSRTHLDYLTRINLLELDKRSQSFNLQKKNSKMKDNKSINLTNSTPSNLLKMFQPLFNSRYTSIVSSETKELDQEQEREKKEKEREKQEKQQEQEQEQEQEKQQEEKNIIKEIESSIPKEIYYGDRIPSRNYETQYNLENGDGYICIAKTFSNTAINNKDREEDSKKFSLSLDDKSDALNIHTNIFTGILKEEKKKETNEDLKERVLNNENKIKYLSQNGIVETPFGELRLGVRNQYNDKVVSIFFDDQDLEPIQLQLSNLLAIIELVQSSFANLSTIIMKLKNSLNFEDPIIPILTLTIIIIIVLTLNILNYIIRLITNIGHISFLLRGYLLVNFLYWLLHKDPYNLIYLEILNKKNRFDSNIKNKWVIRYFKMIHLNDRNMFTLLTNLKIYDYYPNRFVYKQSCYSHLEETKDIKGEQFKEFIIKKETFPIRILPITLDEYLFFYIIKYIFIYVLIMGSILRFFQYLFINRIINFYKSIMIFWWYIIPDIREIEHRCIASTQFIGNLDCLLNDNQNPIQYKIINGNAYGILNSDHILNNSFKFNIDIKNSHYNKADLFLKQFYFGKNSNYIKNTNLSKVDHLTSNNNNNELDKNHPTDNNSNTQLINKKSLIDYILPVNKDSNVNTTKNQTNKSEKNITSSYEVLESLLEGFYTANKTKKD